MKLSVAATSQSLPWRMVTIDRVSELGQDRCTAIPRQYSAEEVSSLRNNYIVYRCLYYYNL
jgi:hypothetical protein